LKMEAGDFVMIMYWCALLSDYTEPSKMFYTRVYLFFFTVRRFGKIVRRVLLDCSGTRLNAPEYFYTDFRRIANPLSSVWDETGELSDRQYT
jgi:hypothetical protein